MTVSKRSIFHSSAIETPTGDQGSEGCTSPDPKTTGALGDETAHGDSSLKWWDRNSHKPNLGQDIQGNGAAGVVIGGE